MKIRESIFKKSKRNVEMSIAVLEGATLQTVGEQYGLTGPRVSTVLTNMIFDCNRRYKNAMGKKSIIKSGYLKDLRLRKNELIPFIRKWGNRLTSEDVWSMDIPLLNKIFWDIPNKRPCKDEHKLIEVLVTQFPEDVYHILNKRFDEFGWQIQLTYANRLFTEGWESDD